MGEVNLALSAGIAVRMSTLRVVGREELGRLGPKWWSPLEPNQELKRHSVVGFSR